MTINPDLINACFELGGAAAVANNCYRTWRDKQVKGVSLVSMSFFTAWGLWNLLYYHSLGQNLSNMAGALLVCMNVTWLGLMWKFRKTIPTVVVAPVLEPVASAAPLSLDEVCDILDKRNK
jgi:hypothetical protein